MNRTDRKGWLLRAGLVACGVVCVVAAARVAWVVFDPIALATTTIAELALALALGVFPAMVLVASVLPQQDAQARDRIREPLDSQPQSQPQSQLDSPGCEQIAVDLGGRIDPGAEATGLVSAQVELKPLDASAIPGPQNGRLKGRPSDRPNDGQSDRTNDHRTELHTQPVPEPDADLRNVPARAAWTPAAPEPFDHLLEWSLARQVDALVDGAGSRVGPEPVDEPAEVPAPGFGPVLGSDVPVLAELSPIDRAVSHASMRPGATDAEIARDTGRRVLLHLRSEG